MSLVNEGAEAIKSWWQLQASSCYEAQGDYITKPMRAKQFTTRVQAWEALDTSQEKLCTDLADITLGRVR